MDSNGGKRTIDKRNISFAVFGIGFLGGLYGCAHAAGGVFTIGANDCALEIIAIILGLMTPPLAFVVALWKRMIAGIWLISAGCFFPIGMLAERSYLIHNVGSTDEPSVFGALAFSLRVSVPLVAFGLFATITKLLHWPELRVWRGQDEN